MTKDSPSYLGTSQQRTQMNDTKKPLETNSNTSQVPFHFRKAKFPSRNYPQSDNFQLMLNLYHMKKNVKKRLVTLFSPNEPSLRRISPQV